MTKSSRNTQPLIMIGACVIIINEQNEMLLQHHKDNDCWGLIGGSMELGESLEQVAYREMLEETGLKAQQLTLLHTYSGEGFYYQYPHGEEVYYDSAENANPYKRAMNV